MLRTLRLGLIGVVIGVASGCATDETLNNAHIAQNPYKLAIIDAAVVETDESVTLPTLSGERVRVVTWANFPASYPVGEQVALEWGDVWVTLDNAVKRRCATFDRESLSADTQKLLGLPVDSRERSFVTMVVPVSAIFRPCANPDVIAVRCSAEIPASASSAHKRWYAEQTAIAYRYPNGFPWTRLGYTYNWNDGQSEVGPAEFVVRRSTEVQVVSVDPTRKYCTE